MNFTPTQEQQLIIDAVRSTRDNIMVEALAGCTKTSTLMMSAQRMPLVPVYCLAFNKKIVAELEKVMPKHFLIKTMSGLGYGALMRASYMQGRKLTLNDRKIGKIVSELFKSEDFANDDEDWLTVRDWVNAARNAGIIPKEFEQRYPGLLADTQENWFELSAEPEPSETLYGFARETLRISCQRVIETGEIDFDDMVFASVLLGGVYPKPNTIMGDEVQDWSPLNREQIRKMGAEARLILVGDPKQAIYAFRGADSSSMRNLRDLRPKWQDLTLHTTFRCPKIIVKRNLGHAPSFRAHENNAEGQDISWRRARPEDQIEWLGEKHDGWSYDWLKSLREKPGDRIFIVCRNNAPLLSMAFKLIRRGIGPNMLGREIGKELVRLAKKISKDKDDLKDEALKALIDDWRTSEISKAQIMEKDHLISGIEDKAECLLAVMENPGVHSASELCSALDNLFAREHGEVVLTTGHRVKGLECEIEVHLDPWRIPSRFALINPTQMQQELNLKYVIETRTRRVFIEANLEDFQ